MTVDHRGTSKYDQLDISDISDPVGWRNVWKVSLFRVCVDITLMSVSDLARRGRNPHNERTADQQRGGGRPACSLPSIRLLVSSCSHPPQPPDVPSEERAASGNTA